MIIIVYIIYFKDKQLLSDYFTNDDAQIRKELGENK